MNNISSLHFYPSFKIISVQLAEWMRFIKLPFCPQLQPLKPKKNVLEWISVVEFISLYVIFIGNWISENVAASSRRMNIQENVILSMSGISNFWNSSTMLHSFREFECESMNNNTSSIQLPITKCQQYSNELKEK